MPSVLLTERKLRDTPTKVLRNEHKSLVTMLFLNQGKCVLFENVSKIC